jgi:hypothetical protein
MATPSYYNLAHTASVHFEENNAPSEPGAKHLNPVQFESGSSRWVGEAARIPI